MAVLLLADRTHSFDSNKFPSLMQALVETDNIYIFGTVTVRAIVQYKWETFGLSLWLKEFCVYCTGLALLVALSILDWQNWGLPPDDRNAVPPAVLPRRGETDSTRGVEAMA